MEQDGTQPEVLLDGRTFSGVVNIRNFSYNLLGDITGTLSSGATTVAKCSGWVEIQTDKNGPKGYSIKIYFSKQDDQIRPIKNVGSSPTFDFFEVVVPETMQASYLYLLSEKKARAGIWSGVGFSLVSP